MVRHLTLREGGEAQLVELDDAIVDALMADKAVTATRGAVTGQWELAPSTWVGVVRVGDLQVTITPKVTISRLIFLLGYARDPAFWRDESVLLDGEPDLVEALAHSFGRLARRALEQGVLKGYRTVDESSTVLRGRIREADQIRRHFGRTIPLEITYDDCTVDVAENQILLAAALRLLKVPGLSREVRAGLHRIRLQLADVTAPRGGQQPRWQASRLNARYVPTLHLAEQILRGQSFEQRRGELEVSGFLVNMATVFEDFVCTALSEATSFAGGRSHLQYPAHLDEAGRVPMRPDFVWERDGAPLVVADAKYKHERPSGYPNADLYQMLSYCTVLGLREGHLIYVKGEVEPRLHSVVGSGVTIVCHALDPTGSRAALLVQIERMAAQMYSSDSSERDGLVSSRAIEGRHRLRDVPMCDLGESNQEIEGKK